MERITFTIKGAKELEDLLKQLGPVVARKVMNNALRAGAKPIVDEAKRLAPFHKKRRLKKAVRAELFPPGSNSAVLIKVGLARPWGSLAHLLEFGHVSKNQYGGPWGFVEAHPFLRPAMDTRAQAALRRIGQVAATGIDAAVRSLHRKPQ